MKEVYDENTGAILFKTTDEEKELNNKLDQINNTISEIKSIVTSIKEELNSIKKGNNV